MSKLCNNQYALKCAIDGYVLLNDENIPVVQWNAPEGFTLRTNTALLHLEGSSLLVAQEDMFALKVVNECAVFEIKTNNRYEEVLRHSLREEGVAEKEFIQLDLVIQNNNITLYLMGIPVSEVPVELSSDQRSNKPWTIGRFDGYVSHIEWYGKALQQEELIHKFYDAQEEHSKQELRLDFTEDTYELKPQKNVNIQRTSECRRVNVEHTFYPGKNGFAIPLYQPPVSLIHEEEARFTLLIKAYWLSAKNQQKEVTLFSENSTRKHFFAVGISKETKKPYLTIGEERKEFTQTIPYQQWSDIAVCVDGLKITAFIDGVKSGEWMTKDSEFTKIYKPVIGNELILRNLSQGFEGYINSVAVFDYALAEDTLKKYANNTCFMFSEHLIAYWDFQQECPKEILSQTVLVMGNSSQQILIDDVADLTDWLKMDMEWPEGVQTLSDRDKEEIDDILLALHLVTSTMTNQKQLPPTLTDEQYKTAAKMALQEKKNEDLGTGMGIGVGVTCLTWLGLWGYLFYKDNNAKVPTAFRSKSLCHFLGAHIHYLLSFGYAIGAGVSAGALIGAIVRQNRRSTSNGGLAFRSARWITSKQTGILPVQETLPIWEKNKSTSKCEGVVVVPKTSEAKGPQIELSLNLTYLAKGNNTYKFKLSEATLGETEEQTIEVTKDEERKVSFTFPVLTTKLKTGLYDNGLKIIMSQEILNFDIPIVLKVLPAAPVIPWSETALPSLTLVDLCIDIQGKTWATDEYDFADRFVSWVRKGNRLTACTGWNNGKNKFSQCKFDEITFSENEFVKLWKEKKPVSMGPLDMCALLVAMTRLQGWSSLSIKFAEPSSSATESVLSLRSVIPLGGKAGQENLHTSNYPLCVKSRACSPQVWDTFCELYDSRKNKITDLNFLFAKDDSNPVGDTEINDKTYRSLLCQPKTNSRLSEQSFGLSFGLLIDESKQPYAIILIDLWNGHGCKAAADCVTELSARINNLLLDLLENDPKAFFVMCPSGMNERWKLCPDFDEMNKRANNQVVISDYHIGVRKKFCFKWKVPNSENSKWFNTFDTSRYVEFEHKNECDCIPNEKNHPKQPDIKNINKNLEPFFNKLKANKDNRGIVVDNTDILSQYLSEQSVRDVYVMGVHTNMCIVFRKCGILQLLRNKFRVHLVTDLTDARISRFHYPYQEHFQATETLIDYITHTPILTKTVLNKCLAITSDVFNTKEKFPTFRFDRDFRYPTKPLAASTNTVLTDTYSEYNQAGRPMFPIALYYECNDRGINTLLFEYANAKHSNKLLRLGVGCIGPQTTKIKFYPGEYLIEATIQYSKEKNADRLVSLSFSTTEKREVSIQPASLPSGLTQEIRKANRNYTDGDYFGNKDYAFLCPQITSFVRNGQRCITGIEFYATTFNKFKVTSENNNVEVNKIDFLYKYNVEDLKLDLTPSYVEQVEHYAFVFFEGDFYLYEHLDGEYHFIRRTDSLLLNQSSYYEAKSIHVDAQILEANIDIPFCKDKDKTATFRWVTNNL